jgi:hypothetical protein
LTQPKDCHSFRVAFFVSLNYLATVIRVTGEVVGPHACGKDWCNPEPTTHLSWRLRYNTGRFSNGSEVLELSVLPVFQMGRRECLQLRCFKRVIQY